MTPDDARRALLAALTVERFTHLPETPRRATPHATRDRQTARDTGNHKLHQAATERKAS